MNDTHMSSPSTHHVSMLGADNHSVTGLAFVVEVACIWWCLCTHMCPTELVLSKDMGMWLAVSDIGLGEVRRKGQVLSECHLPAG
jgi:hypothetical protein